MGNHFMIFSVIFSVSFIKTFQEEGSDCTKPGVENGRCITTEKCDFVKRLFEEEKTVEIHERLNKLNCGFVKKTALVCCPIMETNEYKSPLEIPKRNFSHGQYVELLRPPNCGVIRRAKWLGIAHGTPAEKDEYPWMVALGYKSDDEPNSTKWFCGGSLISKRHILTAAHCVRTTNKYELYIARVGDLDLYSKDDDVIVSDILIEFARVHEDYDPRTGFSNDVAILTLERNVDNPTVWPICLPADEPLRSSKFLNNYVDIAGWGSERFQGPSSHVLLRTYVPIVEEKECRMALSKFKKVVIDDRVICAGYREGGRDVCPGDSGGPLMYSVDDDDNISIFYAVGIVSFGYRCGQPNSPGVYTRVTHYLDWIQKNMFY